MAHWPKSVYGNVLLFMVALGLALGVVWLGAWLSNPLILSSLGVVALTCTVVYAWRRRVEATRERAWVGSFSFGDVNDRIRAREAVRIGARSGSLPQLATSRAGR